MGRASPPRRTLPRVSVHRHVRAAPRVAHLRMSSRRAGVAPMVERILGALEGAGLDDGQRDDIAVAAAEALSNAAIHGNRLHHDSLVRVTVEVTPGEGAVIEIRDSGAGFDRAALLDPTHPERLLTPGGRGVFLMRRLVDDLEYNLEGNSVRLVMKAKHRRH